MPVACAAAAAARPRSVVALLVGVFADEAGEEARGDGFEGGNGGGEDADVSFDDGPVHRVADYVGRVRRGEHRGNVGDSDDGGDAGTIQGTVSKAGDCPGNTALFGSVWRYLQQPQRKRPHQRNLLLPWHLQLENNPDRQRVRQDVGEDIKRRIAEVKHVDVDTGAGCRLRPRLLHGMALERSRQDIREGLRRHDCEHDIRQPGENAVPEAGVEPQRRGLDEAQTG